MIGISGLITACRMDPAVAMAKKSRPSTGSEHSSSAGPLFVPKLTQAAKEGVVFAVGLRVLLMVVTIVCVPIVLPLLLSGITIDPWKTP